MLLTAGVRVLVVGIEAFVYELDHLVHSAGLDIIHEFLQAGLHAERNMLLYYREQTDLLLPQKYCMCEGQHSREQYSAVYALITLTCILYSIDLNALTLCQYIYMNRTCS